MSATLRWRPRLARGNIINTFAEPQRFLDVLTILTGGSLLLDEHHIPGLLALAKAGGGEDDKAFKALIEAIKRHHEILVEATY